MTDIDYAELREKAEKALPDGQYGTYTFDGTQRLREFQSIASPQVVLALLDENERLQAERDSVQAALDGFRGVAKRDNEYLIGQRDEALAVIERAKAVYDSWFTWQSTNKRAEEAVDLLLSDISDALDAAPADALRAVKAEAWDEGADAQFYTPDHLTNDREHNPYRTEQS